MRNGATPEVLAELAEAKEQLENAETELQRLMQELVVADRANKQMVSKAITAALGGVTSARKKIEKITVG